MNVGLYFLIAYPLVWPASYLRMPLLVLVEHCTHEGRLMQLLLLQIASSNGGKHSLEGSCNFLLHWCTQHHSFGVQITKMVSRPSTIWCIGKQKTCTPLPTGVCQIFKRHVQHFILLYSPHFMRPAASFYTQKMLEAYASPQEAHTTSQRRLRETLRSTQHHMDFYVWAMGEMGKGECWGERSVHGNLVHMAFDHLEHMVLHAYAAHISLEMTCVETYSY